MIQSQIAEIPSTIRHGIRITTAFVTWVTIKSWFQPLSLENVNNYYILDPELLNVIGMYTIPACFGVIVYFVIRYYERKFKDTNILNKLN